jgi:hypothetical protein
MDVSLKKKKHLQNGCLGKNGRNSQYVCGCVPVLRHPGPHLFLLTLTAQEQVEAGPTVYQSAAFP